MTDNKMKKIINNVVRQYFPEFETLESRGRDSLDFHEVSCWDLKAALEKACNAGYEAGVASTKKGKV